MTVSAALLAAILTVESGGDFSAVGDGGKALGGYQIRAGAWIDGCRFLGIKCDYVYGSRDPATATAVCRAYLEHYGRAYERRTGKPATDEVLARIWNSGPAARNTSQTREYVRKVMAAMEAQRGS